MGAAAKPPSPDACEAGCHQSFVRVARDIVRPRRAERCAVVSINFALKGVTMGQTSLIRGSLALVFACLLAGCAGAKWQQVQVAPSYQPPKQLKIAVVSQSQSTQSDEAIQHLQSSLAANLKGRGITATFVPAPTAPQDANLTVVEWDRGVRALRWLGFGGEGHIVVVVKSPSADGQPGLDGNVRGYVKSGTFGGSSYISATEAGELIATTIATGKTD